MKKLLFLVSFLSLGTVAFTQKEDEDDTRGKFNWNNVFVGGSLNLGAGNGSFAIGGVPEIGYTITKWLDAGILFNVNYQTQRIYDFNGAVAYKLRAFNYGSGAFVRIWPIDQVFVAVQPEYNWIKQNQIDVYTNAKYTTTVRAESLLIGVGYGGREVGRQISYVSIMIDLLKNINSPYRDQYNHAQPVIRTGIGFYLGRRSNR
jgi:hypothetical protein